VKKSGWFNAALITLMRFVSPESIGTIVVPALPKYHNYYYMSNIERSLVIVMFMKI
jgi:hypothetical protein